MTTKTYISQETFCRLIPELLAANGGVMDKQALAAAVETRLSTKLSELDLKPIKTGFGSIPQWKRTMAWAKVTLLEIGTVVQVGRCVIAPDIAPEKFQKLAKRPRKVPTAASPGKRIKKVSGSAITID